MQVNDQRWAPLLRVYVTCNTNDLVITTISTKFTIFADLELVTQ